MKNKILACLVFLAACHSTETSEEIVDGSTPVMDADVTEPTVDAGEDAGSPEIDAGPAFAPFGHWMYDQEGCDLYLTLNEDATYAAGLACPADPGPGTDIFIETGTYWDDGVQLHTTQLASSCPGNPADPYTWDYALNPFRVFIPDELLLTPVPENNSYVEPARYGCPYYDGFHESPLTCHATGVPGNCN